MAGGTYLIYETNITHRSLVGIASLQMSGSRIIGSRLLDHGLSRRRLHANFFAVCSHQIARRAGEEMFVAD